MATNKDIKVWHPTDDTFLKWYQELWLRIRHPHSAVYYIGESSTIRNLTANFRARGNKRKFLRYYNSICEHGHFWDDCPDCRH